MRATRTLSCLILEIRTLSGLAGSAGRLSPQMQLLGVENPCAQLHTTGHASYAGLGSAAVPSSLQYFVLLL